MNRIRELRKAKDLTMKQFGVLIGVSESTVSLYEREKREPDNAMLLKIADCFGVSVDYLLGREKTAPARGKGLKEKVVNRLDSLTPQELQRVDDFLSGIQSAHREP